MTTESDQTPREPEAFELIKWNGWGVEGVGITLHPENEFWALHTTGKPMKKLLQFLYDEVRDGKGSKELPALTPSISLEEALAKLNAPTINEAFMQDISAALDSSQVRPDAKSRLSHIVGKNYRDLWRVRKGMVEHAPDCILLPNHHHDCVKIMKLAHQHDVVVIPFGGGTNVTGGIEANPFEHRMIVSVDMRRMNRMLSIDKESHIATFETGVLGPDLDKQLFRYGFMFGHDPDSYIYSTLGGWIGARGSGAMSNQYGDIEDMVISVKVATPMGVIVTPVTSRTCGVDLNGLFIGSEGSFGIVTEATVKLEVIPDVRYYEGFLFPTFEEAFAAFYACNQKGIRPCTMRLYDEDDFRMSMGMSTDSHGLLETIIKKAGQAFLKHGRGWDMRKVSLVIVGYEGTKQRVKFQRQEATTVFKQFGGFGVGRAAGEGWQAKKYDLPYLRDFALSMNHWADVFETSVLYSQAIPCWRAVKNAVRQVWKETGKHGWIGCHTAHQYKFGCCLYFTFASGQQDDQDMKTFLQIKTQAMEAMLKYTGNLTHHHGIGYEHVPWMSRYMGPGCMNLLMGIKHNIDPKNICNPGKLLPSVPKKNESSEELRARQEKEMMFNNVGIRRAVKAHL